LKGREKQAVLFSLAQARVTKRHLPTPTYYTVLSRLDLGSNKDGTSRSTESEALQILKEDTVSMFGNLFPSPEWILTLNSVSIWMVSVQGSSLVMEGW